jgi:membrane-associated phospholipid phosphatase
LEVRSIDARGSRPPDLALVLAGTTAGDPFFASFSEEGFWVAVTLSQVDRLSVSRVRALVHHRWLNAAGRIALNVGAFMILFQTYKMVRLTFVQRSQEIGFDNAERLISWQQHLHIFIEPNVQQWAMSHNLLIHALNWNYFLFMPAFYTYCGIAIAFAPVRFRHLRRVFLSSMLLALPWYAIFPLAPPRFMPSYGLIDTLAKFGPVPDKGGGMVKANHYAAMPSMHIGWTTIGACMVAAAIPWPRVGRAVAVAIVSWMCLTVVATGNHYILDIIGGWIIIGCAFGLANLSERYGPLALKNAPELAANTLLTPSPHRDKSISRPVIRPETNRAGH